MKTYACPRCGDRIVYSTQTRCIKCGVLMHVLNGIIHGGGVTAIWRDGKEIWSGSAHEAVEMLATLLPGDNADYSYRGWTIDECDSDGRTIRIKSPAGQVRRVEFAGNEQAAEADRIVRQLSTVRFIPSSSEVAVESLKAAVIYVRKYPKP